jgi:hypothetical protein
MSPTNSRAPLFDAQTGKELDQGFNQGACGPEYFVEERCLTGH